MDPEKLRHASETGDIKFLERAVASKPPDDYWLSKSPGHYYNGCMFHSAAYHVQVEFIRKAIELLPPNIIHQLIVHQDLEKANPFHVAVGHSHSLQVVKLMLDFYKSGGGAPFVNEPHNKPWLVHNGAKDTALFLAIVLHLEDCAMELISMDVEVFCEMLDKDGNSMLFDAITSKLYRVVEKILTSDGSSILLGKYRSNPLHYACHYPENITKLLLKKHPECLDVVVTLQWLEDESFARLKLLLEGDFPAAKSKFFKDLISVTDEINNDTPLHFVIRNENSEIALLLIENMFVSCSNCTEFWMVKNNDGITPFHMSFSSRLEQVALRFLSLDPTLYEMFHNNGESPLFSAIRLGFENVVEEILKINPNPPCNMLRNKDNLTVLHLLQFCSEKIGVKLLEKFWWMINLRDNKKTTALDKAKEGNVAWLIHLLINPTLIQKEPFDWITACDRNEAWAVIAFIDTCDDLHEVCCRENDTPLHHIKLRTYRDCLNFLKNPSIMELKNTIDKDGATPLHRALERKDLYLVKALLKDNDAERNIADYNGKTAMDLLAKLCKDDRVWADMCKQVKVNPHLRTTYIQPGTNLGEMRTTLSVVAALLATITFAAGFTIPGGLNSQTGDAMLGKKASFIVFLLADVYAMCTSMLVLFCLIWSMVSTRDMATLLIDRSVLILMQSLYGTMLAFMTGIFTVVAKGSLGAAIATFAMCSIIIILTHRNVLSIILSKLIPASNQEDTNDRLEEGIALTSRNDNT